MQKRRAIVFDLDDTLYPERDYVLSGFAAVARWAESSLGISAPQGFAELEKMFAEGIRGDTFNRWLAMHDLGDNFVNPLLEVYRNHRPVLKLFPEIPALLDRLHQTYQLGLLSDGYLSVQKLKLAALGLAHHFDAVVFSDAWGRECWKPSLKPFQEISELLVLDPVRIVYVGDNPTKDFYGARRLGMRTVHLLRAGSEYSCRTAPTAEYAAHACIASLTELEPLLLRIEGAESMSSGCTLKR